MRKTNWRTSAARALRSAANVPTVEQAIEVLVLRVRMSCEMSGLLAPDLAAAPYDPAGLAYSLGATSVQSASIPVDGQLIRRKGEIILEYSERASPQRQRFTIAHEVGHLLLWDVMRRVTKLPERGPGRNSEVEILCNKIAAEILAPRKEVQNLWSRSKDTYNPHIACILELVQYFDISLQVAAIRFREISAPNTGVALMNFEQRRFDWFYGIPDSVWLSELLIARYCNSREVAGLGTYNARAGGNLKQKTFEWQRMSPRSCLIVVP